MVYMIESQVAYVELPADMRAQGLRPSTCGADAQAAYNDELQRACKRTVWATGAARAGT